MAQHTSNIQKTQNDNRVGGRIGVEGVGDKHADTLEEGFKWMADVGIHKCGIYLLVMCFV